MFRAHVLIIRRSKLHYTASGGRLVHETTTYRCDDTRGCVMQFWPPDDGHMVLETCRGMKWNLSWNKFCASSWLNTEINILNIILVFPLSWSSSFVCIPRSIRHPVHIPHFVSINSDCDVLIADTGLC